ncbi:MAG: VWA domain-containing protein [Candidatus Bipolaricaulia bacterium]
MFRFEHPWILILVSIVPIYLYLNRHRLRERPYLAIRGLVVILLLVTLAGPQWGRQVRTNYIYFVADLSDSLMAARSQIFERIKTMAIPEPHNRYGLIVFGEEPHIESGFTGSLTLEPETEVLTTGTDIAAALDLALETFPAGNREIILMSDGNLTIGDQRLEATLGRAREAGIRISVLPIEPVGDELWVETFQVPNQVDVGIPFHMRVQASTTHTGIAELILYRNGQYRSLIPVALTEGSNIIRLSDRIDEPGSYHYRVYIQGGEDLTFENNRLSGMTSATGSPGILLVEGEPGPEPGAVAQLLTRAGYRFQHAAFGDWVATLPALSSYKVIILEDIPIGALNLAQIEALRRYVRDLGGGMVVIQGGEAVSGLQRTEFETLLPISYERPQRVEIPSIAIVFVLDRSGSMGGYAGGVHKIELLKEAAAASIEILEEEDLVGIIGFSRDFEWIADIQKAGDRREIYRQLRELRAGGGTDLYYALEDAFRKIVEVDALLKHIIVFTDGKVIQEGRNFRGLLAQIRENRITASAIGIGERPDVEILRAISQVGGGDLYLVDDIRRLPQISVKETRRVAQRRWVTGDIPIKRGPYTGVFDDLEIDEIPELDGYVLTYPKPTALTALVSDQGDPVLAFWRYGLGKVAVLNTDLRGRWSEGWILWDRLSNLFGGTIREVYGEVVATENLRVGTELTEEGLTITADAQESGNWMNFLNVHGQLVSVNQPTQEIQLTQVAPGRYQVSLSDLAQGSYLLRLQAEGEGTVHTVEQAVTVPYPQEFRRIGLNAEILERIARATDGQYITDPVEAVLGANGREAAVEYRDLWREGLIASLLLFILDLALRQLTPLWLSWRSGRVG